MLQNSFAVALRKRTPWEAVDLGFKLIGNNFKAVFLPWLTLFLLLIVPLFATLHSHPLLILYITFMVMPLLERSCLFVLSRSVFGTVPTYKEVLKNWPKQCKTGWLAHTLFLRFSPSRAFHLPVYQLENLKGLKNRKRRKVLARGNGSLSLNTTFLFSLFEAMMVIGVFTFLKDFVPNAYLQGLVDDFRSTGVLNHHFILFFVGLYLGAVAFLRPFYMACSFSLYLNRRMELEGWDIELTFRKMAGRLKGKSTAALLVLSLLTCFSTHLAAQEDVLNGRFQRRYSTRSGIKSPKKVIEEVMKTEEFNRSQTVTRWKRIDDAENRSPKEVDSVPSSASYRVFMELLKILIITALVVLIAVVIFNFMVNRRELEGGLKQERKMKPATVTGVALEEQVLPENLTDEAMALWKSGEVRAAYSLLYRGALSKLVNDYDIELNESFTEADCVRAVKRFSESEVSAFFSSLAGDWCMLAYAHITPSGNFSKLCSDFNSCFIERSEVAS